MDTRSQVSLAFLQVGVYVTPGMCHLQATLHSRAEVGGPALG